MRLEIAFLLFFLPHYISEKVYLLDTLNAASDLYWPVFTATKDPQAKPEGWLAESYAEETEKSNYFSYSTCSMERTDEHLENYLLLPRLRVQEDTQLYVEAQVNIKRCRQIMGAGKFCEDSVKLYAISMNESSALPAQNWHNVSGWEYVDTWSNKGEQEDTPFNQTSEYSPKGQIVHFAVKDTGACVALIFVLYRVCAERTDSLTNFPRTLTAKRNLVKQVNGTCVRNANVVGNAFKRPISICTADGEWQLMTNECQCEAGYIQSKTSNTCAPCGIGSFKPENGIGECRQCPAHSYSRHLGSAVCPCEADHYRPAGARSDSPCFLATPHSNFTINDSVPNSVNADNSSYNNATLYVVAGICAIFLSIIFVISIFLHRRWTLIQNGGSELDVLDYKHANGHLGCDANAKYTFGAAPSNYPQPVMSNGRRDCVPYVDPTLYYENPRDAVGNFATEIAPEFVELTQTIGGGEFGEVWIGTLRTANNAKTVAVKMLKENHSREAQDNFLLEASVMGQFHHANVVQLLGVVSKRSPNMIITEYMVNGSLDKFLQAKREISFVQMVKMMKDIACGMEYLSRMNFIHRDLAARNILVDDALTCKISDFGLSRIIGTRNEQDYASAGGKIPIRWTAPEAIKQQKYTVASDVWSFGVTLWEICSMGCRPYGDWSNRKVMDEVERGYRLPCPENASLIFHNIMLRCWSANKDHRPNFTELHDEFRAILDNYISYSSQVGAREHSYQSLYTSVSARQLHNITDGEGYFV